MDKNTLCKAERLSSKMLIEKMFAGGAKSFSVFPLRVVFMPINKIEDVAASILISVSKKRFKHAVERNRVKRQIREAYRRNKHELIRLFGEREDGVAIAFIYLSNDIVSTAEIEAKIKILLARIIEKTME